MQERVERRRISRRTFLHSAQTGALLLISKMLTGCSLLLEETKEKPPSPIPKTKTPEKEKAFLEFTEKNFNEEVVQSEIPILVVFWASWCPSCRFLDPTIEELAKEYQAKVKIGKIDVDKSPRLAQKLAQEFRLRYTPSLIFIKEREVRSILIGAHPEETIRQNLDSLLKTPISFP